MHHTILGIDPSLTSTGYSIIKKGNLLDSGTIKTKPSNKTPTEETLRLRSIKNSICEIIEKYTPALVVIEGLAFMARNTTALVQLSGLNYMIRDELISRDIQFIVVAPTSLKKFITGKGNAQKDHIMLSIYQNFGQTFFDNNIADSYGLAAIGAAIKDEPIKKTTLPQKEVIKLLKTQLL